MQLWQLFVRSAGSRPAGRRWSWFASGSREDARPRELLPEQQQHVEQRRGVRYHSSADQRSLRSAFHIARMFTACAEVHGESGSTLCAPVGLVPRPPGVLVASWVTHRRWPRLDDPNRVPASIEWFMASVRFHSHTISSIYVRMLYRI